ncbi:hypothetical protein D3C87_1275480 [compost metagenome]
MVRTTSILLHIVRDASKPVQVLPILLVLRALKDGVFRFGRHLGPLVQEHGGIELLHPFNIRGLAKLFDAAGNNISPCIFAAFGFLNSSTNLRDTVSTAIGRLGRELPNLVGIGSLDDFIGSTAFAEALHRVHVPPVLIIGFAPSLGSILTRGKGSLFHVGSQCAVQTVEMT